MIVAAMLLAAAGDRWATWLALFVGAGQAFAGASDICLLGLALAKMPWNQVKPSCAGLKV